MSYDPLSWLDDELSQLDNLGLRRCHAIRESPQAAQIVVDGHELINFSTNNYLGLAADQRLYEAVSDAVQRYGYGSGASPLITGRSSVHAELEQRLADFEGCQSALLFSSGFAANLGTIAALASRGAIIFSDQKNHASIVDGCRLSGARVQIYPHGNTLFLEDLLKQASGFRLRMIVTDSLFSMDGDLAPLDELADLAERYEAVLMVDEAHATGVFGQLGRGVSEHLGVEHRVPIRVGTLSKSFGCSGGFVVGQQSLIDWLLNRARSYVFSTAPPAAASAAALAALQAVIDEPHRRLDLLDRANALRERLRLQGWNTGSSSSQIIPLFVGEPSRAMEISQAMKKCGYLLPGIRPPTVPDGESLLRISLSYDHTTEMIEGFLTALENARDKYLG